VTTVAIIALAAGLALMLRAAYELVLAVSAQPRHPLHAIYLERRQQNATVLLIAAAMVAGFSAEYLLS
jgi:hypothetical protein